MVLFGYLIGLDNCGFFIISELVFIVNLDVCGVGIIEWFFVLMDDFGNSFEDECK